MPWWSGLCWWLRDSGDAAQQTEPAVEAAMHEHYRSIFDKYGTDESGCIPLRELGDILRNDSEVPRKIVRKVFHMSHNDKNGKIDYHEFIGVIHNKNFKEHFVHCVNIYIRFMFPHRYLPILGKDVVTEYAVTKGLYEEQYSCCPLPVAMLIISVFDLIYFLINNVMKQESLADNIFIYNPYRRFECWRYLTYMFVHVGYTHLVVNLIIQLLLGIPLEMVHKWWRVLLVYFAGIVAASLATSMVDPKIYLAGASGGVYALMTAHVATIIMNWKSMSYPLVQLFIFIIIASVDFGSAIHSIFWLESSNSCGYSAHFAGAMAGLLVGTWVLKSFLPTTKQKYMWWCALVIFIVSMGVMIVLNIAWTEHFPASRAG